MEKLNKVAKVSAKIIEVIQWIAVIGFTVVLILSFVITNMFNEILGIISNEISIYDYNNTLVYAADTVTIGVIRYVTITGIVGCGLMAMIARNVYLIFKTMEGTNKNVAGKGPFQPDVVRMVREIGIFFILIPLSTLVLSGLGGLFVGTDYVHSSIDLGSIMTGVIVLCLSQVFAYGAQLQNEVDELL